MITFKQADYRPSCIILVSYKQLFWHIGFDYELFYISTLLMGVICEEGRYASHVKIFMIHTFLVVDFKVIRPHSTLVYFLQELLVINKFSFDVLFFVFNYKRFIKIHYNFKFL